MVFVPGVVNFVSFLDFVNFVDFVTPLTLSSLGPNARNRSLALLDDDASYAPQCSARLRKAP